VVFTQLLKDIGVKGLQVVSITYSRAHLSFILNSFSPTPYLQDDIYSLDSASLSILQPIHALIFLFKWVGKSSDETTGTGGQADDEHLGVYFANQVSALAIVKDLGARTDDGLVRGEKVINNSCGTLAALNAVMNIPPRDSEYKDEVIEHGVSMVFSWLSVVVKVNEGFRGYQPELTNLREFGNGMDSMS
jgi:ubiquitin carboxyl-terminal hydrolase L5